MKKQLIRLAPKLIVGHGYIRARSLDCQDIALPAESIQKTARKRLTVPTNQQWKKGIREAYQRLQAQRDRVDLSKHDEPVHMSMSIQPLPEEVPLAAEMSLEQAPRYEFRSPCESSLPLPAWHHRSCLSVPPRMDESHGVIIPFKTPPAVEYDTSILIFEQPKHSLSFRCFRSPPSDRLQLAADDTIVNPRRLMNKTLGNITQMSFVRASPSVCSTTRIILSVRSISILIIVHRPKAMRSARRRSSCSWQQQQPPFHHRQLLSSAPQPSSIRTRSSPKRHTRRRSRRKRSTSLVNRS